MKNNRLSQIVEKKIHKIEIYDFIEKRFQE